MSFKRKYPVELTYAKSVRTVRVQLNASIVVDVDAETVRPLRKDGQLVAMNGKLFRKRGVSEGDVIEHLCNTDMIAFNRVDYLYGGDSWRDQL